MSARTMRPVHIQGKSTPELAKLLKDKLDSYDQLAPLYGSIFLDNELAMIKAEIRFRTLSRDSYATSSPLHSDLMSLVYRDQDFLWVAFLNALNDMMAHGQGKIVFTQDEQSLFKVGNDD